MQFTKCMLELPTVSVVPANNIPLPVFDVITVIYIIILYRLILLVGMIQEKILDLTVVS